MANEKTWADNHTKIKRQWPEAQFSPEERDDFHNALKKCNQPWLHDAISEAFKRSTWKQPRLSEILSAYDKISDARMPSREMGVTRGANKWFVDWEKPYKYGKPGQTVTVSSDCPDEVTARDHAFRVGGRVRKHGEASATPLPQVNLDDYSLAQLAAAIATLRTKAFLSAKAMPSDHAAWTEHQRGVVEYQLVEQPTVVATEPIADGKWHGIKHARAAIDDDPKRAAEYDRLVADHPALAKIVKAQDDARIQRAAEQKETT